MSALRAFLSGRLWFFLFLQAFDRLALRIVAAGEEAAVTAFLHHHLRTAVRTDLIALLRFFLALCIAALREIDAGDELAIAAVAVYELTAALRTQFPGALQLFLLHVVIGVLHQRIELIPEFLQLFDIVAFSAGDLIEMGLHVGRIHHIDDAAEKFLQLLIGQFSLLAGHEHLGAAAFTRLFQRSIAACLQRIDDHRIGARTADALFLQLLDQARFTVTKRRFREMLLAFQRHLGQFLTDLQWRQHIILYLFILSIDLQVAVKGHRGTVG